MKEVSAWIQPWLKCLTGRDWQKQAFSPEIFFCLGNIIGQSPWIRNQAKLGPQTHGRALRAPGGPWGPLRAKCPFFERNFFLSSANQPGTKNDPNESKKPKKSGIFWSVTPKKRPKWLSGYRWSAAGPISIFLSFSGPKFTGWSWRSTSTLTKTVFGFFRIVPSQFI